MSDEFIETATDSKAGELKSFFSSTEKAWGGAMLGSVIGLFTSFFFTGKTGNVDNSKLRTKYWGSAFIGETVGALAGYIIGKSVGKKNEPSVEKKEPKQSDPDRRYYLVNFPKGIITGVLAGSGVTFLFNKTGVYDKLGWTKAKIVQPVIYGIIALSSIAVPIVLWTNQIKARIKMAKATEPEIEKQNLIKQPEISATESKTIPNYTQTEEQRRAAVSSSLISGSAFPGK